MPDQDIVAQVKEELGSPSESLLREAVWHRVHDAELERTGDAEAAVKAADEFFRRRPRPGGPHPFCEMPLDTGWCAYSGGPNRLHPDRLCNPCASRAHEKAQAGGHSSTYDHSEGGDMGEKQKNEETDNAGQLSIDTGGDVGIGIGGGISVDSDGDVGIDIGGVRIDTGGDIGFKL